MTKPLHLRVVKGGAKRPGLVDAKRWITAVMSDRTLSVATRVAAAYIGSLHNPSKGYAYPSAKRIAQDTGLSLRTVWYAVDLLGKRQWLLINRGGGRGHANTYQINFETVQPGAPFHGEKGCKRSQERVQNDPDKQCNPVHPNKKDSNVEDTTSPRRATRVRASSEPRPAAHSRGSSQDRVPAAQESKSIRPEARSDGGLALGSPPTSPVGKKDLEPILRDIADCQFDWWNDCRFPDLPPIHPATDSEYQTPDAVCKAWLEYLDHVDRKTGDRAITMELLRTFRAGSEQTENILSKAKTPQYIRIAIRNAKTKGAKKAANGSTWHPDDAFEEIYGQCIGAVVPKSTIRKLINTVGPDRAVEIAEQATHIDDDAECLAFVHRAIKGTKQDMSKRHAGTPCRRHDGD